MSRDVRIRERSEYTRAETTHCGSLQTTLCSLPTASLSPKLRKGVHMIVSFAYKVSLSPRSYGYLSSRRPAENPGRGARRQRKKKALRMCGAGRRHFWLNPGLELIFCHPLAPSAARVQLKESKRRQGGAVRGCRRGSFGEWARFESSGDCLPTRILKSRIFKKHPAARFSPLTRLRSLDASIRIHIYVYISIYRCRTIRIYPAYL